MIRTEFKKLKAGRRDLRNFGLLVGGVFALLAIWCGWRGKPFAPYLWIPAVPLLVLAVVAPTALKWPYLAWMSVGLVLGLVVSTVLLTLFFYLLVTPLACFARLLGKDFLTRRFDPGVTSYWLERLSSRTRDRRRYEQQF